MFTQNERFPLGATFMRGKRTPFRRDAETNTRVACARRSGREI